MNKEQSQNVANTSIHIGSIINHHWNNFSGASDIFVKGFMVTIHMSLVRGCKMHFFATLSNKWDFDFS